MDNSIAIIALVVSIASLGFSFYFWAKSFRPIVTAMVKTHKPVKGLTSYDLEIRNSGSLPARNIRLISNKMDRKKAYGREATPENIKDWIACFSKEVEILILHNDSAMRCSFGYTKENDKGFWKYGATIPITIEYESWMTRLSKWPRAIGLEKIFWSYSESQEIQILDSESFTGYMWGEQVQNKTSQRVDPSDIPEKIKQLGPSATVNYFPNDPSPPA